MLQNIRGIVLRVVKYGETSLICTIFTQDYGVQSFIAQGVRSSKSKQSRAGMLQPGFLLDLTIYHKPHQNLQRIKEFHPAYIYTSIQQNVIKNCIAMFSTELLLRLLPENAPTTDLFEFSYDYFSSLDSCSTPVAANYPLHFIIGCSRILGYDITGDYISESSPVHSSIPFILSTEDFNILSVLCNSKSLGETTSIEINATIRNRLLDWLISFMHSHTHHMSEIKSLPVLRTVLHG